MRFAERSRPALSDLPGRHHSNRASEMPPVPLEDKSVWFSPQGASREHEYKMALRPLTGVGA